MFDTYANSRTACELHEARAVLVSRLEAFKCMVPGAKSMSEVYISQLMGGR